MDRALAELRVEGPGVHTTVALHRALLRDPDVTADRHDVQFLDRQLPEVLARAAALADAPAHGLPAAARGSLQLVQTPAADPQPDATPPEGPTPCPTRPSLSATS
jgi:acetyl-CoA carboxylase biotin carboxylase subunit